MRTRPRDRHGWPVRGYAAIAVRGRWAVLALLAVGVYLVLTLLPTLTTVGGGLSGVIGEDDPAVAAQARAVQAFGVPLLTRTAVVQHDPAGLDRSVQVRALRRAIDANRPALAGEPAGPLVLALPVSDGLPGALTAMLPDPAAGVTTGLDPDALRVLPPATTIVTYLFTDPTAPLGVQEQVARAYAAGLDRPDDHVVGVSGTVPLQLEQGRLVQQYLPAVEIASVLAVVLIVGLTFRSVLAPVVTLVAAATTYLVADRVIGAATSFLGTSAPGQLEPVLVALALGLSTDYTILFLSGMERRLRSGEDSRDAAGGAVRDYLTIVVVAGLTVAAGVAALSAARTPLFTAFGPGLALTVATALIVSVLFVPPVMAVLGRVVFWPRDPARHVRSGQRSGRRARWRLVRVLTRHRMAAAGAVVLSLVLLALASLPLLGLRDSVSPMAAVADDTEVHRAWTAASAGFAEGVLSPTEVVLYQPGIGARSRELGALQDALTRQPGVAGVLGPAQERIRLPDRVAERVGLFVAPGRDAARFLVVYDDDPLGADAIDSQRRLEGALPALLAGAGLDRPEVEVAGDTALARGLADSARGDVVRVAILVAAVNLLLLIVFLRALIAPLYLIVCSAAAVAAALGLTSLVFTGLLEQDGLIFFVPFAVGALLASLGSDYNIFGVGDVWQAARTRPLNAALELAVPRSTRAIVAAGAALAASFGLVAIIPVAPFQELAFAMAVGIAIDTLLVRSVLVPGLLVLVGPASAWPSSRLLAAGRRRPRTVPRRPRRR